MNTTAKRRRSVAARRDVSAELARAKQGNDQLLDLLNAILTREGGTIVLSVDEVRASKRHLVHVDLLPPDPDTAGSVARYRISLDSFVPPPPPPSGLRDRIRRLGIWTPGKEG